MRGLDIRGGLRSPQIWGFALLAVIGPWISILFPRVMAGVLPVVALLAVSGFWVVHRRLPVMERMPWLLAAIVVLFCALSALWAPDPMFVLDSTVRMAGAFVSGLLLFFAAGELEEEQRHILRGFFVGGFLFALAFICVNYFTNSMLITPLLSEHDAADLDARDNRGMVVLCLMLWPLLYAAQSFLSREDGRRYAVLLLIPLTFLVSLLTDSQTSGTAIFLGGLLYLFARAYPLTANRLVAYGGAFLILTLPCLVLALRHFDPTIGFDWSEASSGARLEIWYAVAEHALRSPLIGHGMDAARFVSDWGMAHFHYPFETIMHPHNGVLQIWYEFGLLGAAFAAGVWLAVARRVGDLPAREVAVSLTLLSVIAVISTISHGLWQSWWLAAVGLSPALIRMMRQP